MPGYFEKELNKAVYVRDVVSEKISHTLKEQSNTLTHEDLRFFAEVLEYVEYFVEAYKKDIENHDEKKGEQKAPF